MAGETIVTVIGRLGGDPELRFTPSGKAVANFSLASTSRRFDKDKNEWVDADTSWYRVAIWDKYAENVAESLTKGDEIVVIGALVQRSYEKDGEKKVSIEINAREIAPTLRFRSFPHRGHEAKVQRERPTGPAQDDPWSTPAEGATATDEPPF